jgi:hypothetical protein
MMEAIRHYENLLLDDIRGEVWAAVPNYERTHKVSNMGRIKSIERIIPGQLGGEFKKPDKILKQAISRCGYLNIRIGQGEKKATLSVHRIVLGAFSGNSDLHIDHVDGDKKNNCLSNLEYVTKRENCSRWHQSKGKELPPGVQKKRNNFSAQIYTQGRYWSLGTYKTIIEASNRYQQVLSDIQNVSLYEVKASKSLYGCGIIKRSKNRFAIDIRIKGERICSGPFQSILEAQEEIKKIRKQHGG